MHVFREERNERGIGHQRESQRGRGGQDCWLVAKKEKSAFARARRFHYGRQHESRGFRELSLGRKGRAEFRKGLDCMQ